VDHPDDVLLAVVVNADGLRQFPESGDVARRDDAVDRRARLGPGLAPVQQFEFLVLVRVAEAEFEQEPVFLGFGQREGALAVLDGVLRRDDEERLRQAVGLAVDGDLFLPHRLQQGGLGLRRGAIDLVREHDVREHRAGTELELAGPLVEHGVAGDVRRQHVRSELDPGEGQPQRTGDAPGGEGLPGPGDVLEQDVSAREHARQRDRERPPVGDHGGTDLVEDVLRDAVPLVYLHTPEWPSTVFSIRPLPAPGTRRRSASVVDSGDRRISNNVVPTSATR